MAIEEIRLWAMDGSGGATSLPFAQQAESERLLEDTLVNNPELLMEGLTLVGRQAPTEGGPLDLLGIDRDGRLVVFELKRGILSREAVAQIIDYASFLNSKPDGELASYISKRSGSRGIDKIEDFEEWYGEKSDGQGLGELRPVRMVLVGLGVDERTTRMVRFLGEGGMDVSLLTFHGYSYNGSTLLARRVQVDAGPETEVARKPSRRLGRRIRRELLEQRIDAHNGNWPEARELWDAVLQMFRENIPGVREWASGGASDWSKHRLQLGIPGAPGASVGVQMGPFDGHPELVMPIFYRDTVNSALPEFVQIRRELYPSYWTYPAHRREVDAGDVEVGFPMKSLAEWEEHKERLAALTRLVCEARYAAANDADEDDD